MLHHGGQRHLKGLGQMRDRHRPRAEPLKHRAARRVAERMEDAGDVGITPFHLPRLPPPGAGWPALPESLAKFLLQFAEQLLPSLFAHCRSIGIFEVRALVGKEQIGSGAIGDQLDCGERC